MPGIHPVLKGLFAASVAGCLVFAGGEAAYADSLVRTIPRIKPNVVGVGTYQEIRRPPSQLLGTGFSVIDDRHFITNAHVLPKLIEGSHREFYCIFVGTGANAEIVRVTVVSQDEEHDVALLRAEKGVQTTPLELDFEDIVAEGMSIAFTGFPIGLTLGLYPVTHRGMVSAKTPIAIPQTTPRSLDPQMIKRLRSTFDVLQLDATAYPGNSGSPLYDPESGKVVGIVSSVFVKSSREKTLSDPSGISYAIPIKFAIDLLRQEKLLPPR